MLSKANHLDRSIVSYNILEGRKSSFSPNRWILDSGAFTRISRGQSHVSVDVYASAIATWSKCGFLEAAVTQDYMCEPFVLSMTGLSVRDHQLRTTYRFLSLRELVVDTYVMPVLQGFSPDEYAQHVRDLDPELPEGAWVGVGSVCKRQGNPVIISQVLTSILRERPDLRLHGFGVKSTSLASMDIHSRFYSCDSMAWSYAGRREDPKRNNDIEYAIAWADKIESLIPRPSQIGLGL